MVSQVWEGVSRMTALAKQTTQAFLEGSVVLGQPLPGISLLLHIFLSMYTMVLMECSIHSSTSPLPAIHNRPRRSTSLPEPSWACPTCWTIVSAVEYSFIK